MSRTAAQQAFFDATLARMKAEISKDVATGRVPQSVASFGDLHDHVDANEYGGLCEDSDSTGPKGLDRLAQLFPDPEGAPDHGTTNSQAGMDVANELQGLVDAWIQGGALRALPIHFEGFEHEGTQITNPTVSDCSRFPVSPETYGFEEYSTGGGFTAWAKTLPDGTVILLTDIEGESHELGEPGALFMLGTSDEDGTDTGLWEMTIGVAFSIEDGEDEDAPRNIYLQRDLGIDIAKATRQQAHAFSNRGAK